jgi:hypothetical protein
MASLTTGLVFGQECPKWGDKAGALQFLQENKPHGTGADASTGKHLPQIAYATPERHPFNGRSLSFAIKTHILRRASRVGKRGQPELSAFIPYAKLGFKA